ncbi:MAG: hypothetical protein SOI44_03120 [Lactimicrobium sp.]|jgi:hypothetical protein|uniref:hypothetical protein n=1 Tax=Lactimicrobium sp. TaxID=2563780 RepID=UPI002F34F375
MIRKLSIVIVYGVMAAIVFLAVRADLHANQTPQVPFTSEETSAAVQAAEIQDAWLGNNGTQSNALILLHGYKAVMISYDNTHQDVSLQYSSYLETQMSDASSSFWRMFASEDSGRAIASIKASGEGTLLMKLPDGSVIPAQAMSSGKASELAASAQAIQNGFNQGGQNENQ